MEFNPFDMFGGDRHPFPQRRTQSQGSSFPPNSQTPPQPMHENVSSWGWPFEVPCHGSRNDPRPNEKNYRRESAPPSKHHENRRKRSFPPNSQTPPPASKPTTSRTNAHLANEKNAEATTSRKGRVVSIPVYDAGTESPSVSTKAAKVAAPRMEQRVAAVKIQSTFRGFSVRKSKPLEKLRIIGQVKSEADEIGRRLSTQTQLIRGNECESRKLDHQILSLLLRLDAIEGAKSFVRESRKAVYRLLLQLEETLDAIIAGKSMTMEGGGQQIDHEHTPEMDSHSHSDRKSGTPELSETQPQTEEVSKKEENCMMHAADCERDTCQELKGLDLSSAETAPVPVNEAHNIGGETTLSSSETVPVPVPAPANEPVQHIGGESIQCDAACDDHGDEKGKGRAAVEKMEYDTIQKVLAYLYRKVESNDKLINDLSFRVAQLERLISKDDDNDTEK